MTPFPGNLRREEVPRAALSAEPRDGDGLSAVHINRWDGHALLLEARRGIDGSLLWRVEFPPELGWSAADLDGDGTADFFLL